MRTLILALGASAATAVSAHSHSQVQTQNLAAVSPNKAVVVGDDVGTCLQSLGVVVKSVFNVVAVVETALGPAKKDVPDTFVPDLIATLQDASGFCEDGMQVIKDYKPDSRIVQDFTCPQLNIGALQKHHSILDVMDQIPALLLVNGKVLSEVHSILSDVHSNKQLLDKLTEGGPSKPVATEHISKLVGDGMFLVGDIISLYVDKKSEAPSKSDSDFDIQAVARQALAPAARELNKYRSVFKTGSKSDVLKGMDPLSKLRVASAVSTSLGFVGKLVSDISKTVADAEAPLGNQAQAAQPLYI